MKFAFIILFVLIAVEIFPQAETIPADHPVYPFLEKMHVQGALQSYDDIILPLSRLEIVAALKEVDNNKEKLSGVELEFLERLKEKFVIDFYPGKLPLNVFGDFPQNFFGSLIQDREKHLYSYHDSLINFYLDPVLQLKEISSDNPSGRSFLFNFGGKASGSYDGWFGFGIKGTNGIQSGNRNTARLDQTVEQSFTFNETRINYFDATEGYFRIQKGILGAQIGRERILWGAGAVDRMTLSQRPPIFDFIRFNVSYKQFSYDFLHGWLVQKPALTYVDSALGSVKTKPSKYLAVSRFGYKPLDNLSFGIQQMMLYSNRSFELAYVNPFLFWESAQRSMNDLDNGYLSMDGRYIPVAGLELNASIIFDDLNFDRWFKGEWNTTNNGIAWQTGAVLSDPLMIKNLTVKIEYLQLRPYMFSHAGIDEALTYTNNGYMLGIDLPPNSTKLSFDFHYRTSELMELEVKYFYALHGRNIYDDKGRLVENFGGNVLEFPTPFDKYFVYLLGGERERSHQLDVFLSYELAYGMNLKLAYQHKRMDTSSEENRTNNFWALFQLLF